MEENVKDNTDAVKDGTKRILRSVAKAKAEIGAESFKTAGLGGEEMWTARTRKLSTLLKSKSSGDCRNLIMGVEKDNGWEAWRSLSIRFEPQVGIRRLRETAELGRNKAHRRRNRQAKKDHRSDRRNGSWKRHAGRSPLVRNGQPDQDLRWK